MQANEHDLNSLQGMIRKLQEENATLKRLFDENNIVYASSEIVDVTEVPDEYDEDQGARIIPLNPDIDMAKEFYGYFWGRTDVYARRRKNGGYFPRCSAWWDTPYDACKNADPKWEIGKDIPAGALDGITRESIDNVLIKGHGEFGETLERKSLDISL